MILFRILPTGPQLGTHHSPQFKKKTADLLQGPHKACWLSCFLCKWKINLLRFEPCQGLPPHGLGLFSTPRSSGPGVPQENKRTDRLAASAFRAQVVKPRQQADLVTQRCYLPLQENEGGEGGCLLQVWNLGFKAHNTERPSQAQEWLLRKALV